MEYLLYLIVSVAFIALLFFREFHSSSDAIGKRGEKKVSSRLDKLPSDDYMVLNDVLIKSGNYTTQIDHIVISRYGVFVIETKNIHGKIYGSENAEYWKQYLPDVGFKRYGTTQEHQLRNPFWQNAGHIKSLRRLVFGNDVPIHGVVVFPYNTDLYVNCDQPLLRVKDVAPYIKQFRTEVLSDEQISYYRRRLLEVMSTSEDDRQYHLENIQRNKARRDAAVASGKCPLCGKALVLRNGPYGSFYGCSGYPNCKYKLPV